MLKKLLIVLAFAGQLNVVSLWAISAADSASYSEIIPVLEKGKEVIKNIFLIKEYRTAGYDMKNLSDALNQATSQYESALTANKAAMDKAYGNDSFPIPAVFSGITYPLTYFIYLTSKTEFFDHGYTFSVDINQFAPQAAKNLSMNTAEIEGKVQDVQVNCNFRENLVELKAMLWYACQLYNQNFKQDAEQYLFPTTGKTVNDLYKAAINEPGYSAKEIQDLFSLSPTCMNSNIFNDTNVNSKISPELKTFVGTLKKF